MRHNAHVRNPLTRVGSVWVRLRMVVLSIIALVMVGAGVSVVAPAAHAARVSPKAVVVHKAMRGAYGKILVTASSLASLYFAPGNVCTGSCLQSWPPLLMPAGKTVPKGSRGLGTTPFGSGQLLVTYHGMGLYTYIGDSGTSLNGAGVDGFYPAVVSRY